jgi:hypothetical protein
VNIRCDMYACGGAENKNYKSNYACLSQVAIHNKNLVYFCGGSLTSVGKLINFRESSRANRTCLNIREKKISRRKFLYFRVQQNEPTEVD